MYVIADDKGLSKNCSFHKENIVMYSSFQNLESKLNYKNFSIKYVIDGIENYEINGQSHRIKKENFYCATELKKERYPLINLFRPEVFVLE